MNFWSHSFEDLTRIELLGAPMFPSELGSLNSIAMCLIAFQIPSSSNFIILGKLITNSNENNHLSFQNNQYSILVQYT